jgi:hypothetical protein
MGFFERHEAREAYDQVYGGGRPRHEVSHELLAGAAGTRRGRPRRLPPLAPWPVSTAGISSAHYQHGTDGIGAMIAKEFILAKTFRAQGTNYLHQEKSLRDQRATDGVEDQLRPRRTGP